MQLQTEHLSGSHLRDRLVPHLARLSSRVQQRFLLNRHLRTEPAAKRRLSSARQQEAQNPRSSGSFWTLSF